MTAVTICQARARFSDLVEQVANTHEPIRIVCGRRTAVLLSSEDWNAIQETLYLLSVPGMRESIRKGIRTPLAECRRRWV
ncbi:MAG: type II toxin-antitoxin system Phd/YefM family antitoxin [Candidatus Coatesbacteria bacterium]